MVQKMKACIIHSWILNRGPHPSNCSFIKPLSDTESISKQGKDIFLIFFCAFFFQPLYFMFLFNLLELTTTLIHFLPHKKKNPSKNLPNNLLQEER